ncbi:unnamed protein product [Clonostachys chloroleuca]|uniref:Zn(2)-C6 fungal-type domain-containing protein n=1 Tax=Clonostachys chloroleuca TaxID=1926264 RepID=A0AA35LTP6_9HYPO|nr:unnamed protein product [Clonostachys chloroleuca]
MKFIGGHQGTPKKIRVAARGARKVKTGCLTCKIRHKKCDESKPACLECISAGWKCDFPKPLPLATSGNIARLLPNPLVHNRQHVPPLLNLDGLHMDYFRVVCAPEFSLYFELPIWENLILQAATTDATIYLAALAIGALGRSRYYPGTDLAGSATRYSLQQYGSAIRALQSRLDPSPQSLELSVLASFVFVVVEIHLGLSSKAELHARAALALIRSPTGVRLHNHYLLHSAAAFMEGQLDSFQVFDSQQVMKS